MIKTIHFFISGRVQGVCFRMATREQAQLFGINGWVRNLADGRVEVMATGEEEVLKELQDWLHKGPSMAKVLNVRKEQVDYQWFDGFSVR